MYLLKSMTTATLHALTGEARATAAGEHGHRVRCGSTTQYVLDVVEHAAG